MKSFFKSAWRENAGIRLGLWWNIALAASGLVALPFDQRHILGLNPRTGKINWSGRAPAICCNAV